MPDNKSPTFHRNEPPAAKAPHPSPPATPTGGAWTYSVYGAAGELLGTFKGCSVGGVQFLCEARLRVYFGGRLILNGWTGVRPDRLGSPDGAHGRVYPYGEVSGSVTTDQDETYTTYTRDTYTGLDYAKNRSYAYSWGRFLTADPYRASGGPENPASWNRYAYVENDPVSLFDPAGLQAQAPIVVITPSVTVTADVGLINPFESVYSAEYWDGGVTSGGSGGGGGGGSSVSTNTAKTIWAALDVALTKLDSSLCRALFGTSASPDPRTVLKELLYGSSQYGIVTVDDIPDNPQQVTSATTQVTSFKKVDIGNDATQSVAATVRITINNLAGSFINGDITQSAATLLHELGHACALLANFLGGSAITSDGGDVKKSEANQQLIKEYCF